MLILETVSGLSVSKFVTNVIGVLFLSKSTEMKMFGLAVSSYLFYRQNVINNNKDFDNRQNESLLSNV